MAQPLDPSEPIAIIGLGGVFPGATDIPGYWKNIVSKVDSVVEVPKDRWDWRTYWSADHKAADKTYSKIGGFVLDFKFDPLKLRIPPGVAKQMDTVQQLAVASTAEALKDAGYADKEFDRSQCAVIFGNSMGGPKKEASDLRVYTALYLEKLAASPAFAKLPAAERESISAEVEASVKSGLMVITEDSMPGELSNVIAGRVANVFNLNGANFTVDAACAASLGAVAQAVNGLRLRQFDMAITGGVDQMMAAPAYVKFAKIGALSADGSRPFDAGANGFVMGEGCGVLVLKRVSDALRDGDRIYALLRSIGASSDGRGKGITAPNPKGQRLAMERAFAGLDYGPADVGLLEAHGTSTPVGDVVEVQSAAEMFKGVPAGSVALGSVKSQIGHLKAAAGAAGLVKTALAIYNKTLPPSINFKTPNPGIDWKTCPFFVNTEARPWDAKGKPRRANVSAFGFGGTNFHIAMEEATPETTKPSPRTAAAASLAKAAEAARPLPPALGAEPFCIGGADENAVFNTLERVAAGAPQDGPLSAYAATVNRKEAASAPVRLSLAAESSKALREKTALVLKNRAAGIWEKTPPVFKPKSVHVGRGTAGRPKVAFLFPGQGSQYVDMLKDLRDKYQVVADTFAEADRIMTRLIGEPLSDILFTKGGETAEQLQSMAERIKRTEITQPAVLTADVAILRLLRKLGVEPDMVAGHSLGEYGALVAADVLTFEQALDAVSARGREMAGVMVADNGKMASVAWPVEKVEAVLKKVDGYVIAANKNCHIQTVIAGASAAVEAAVKLFQAEGVQAQLIEVSHAFHSDIVAPATPPFGKFLERIQPKSPRIPVLSNVTADYYPADPAKVRELMTRQISSAVEWIRQMERMYADGVRIFVECGPKRALTAFVTSTLEDKKDVFATSSNHPKRGGIMELNDMLARFTASGIPVDFSALDPANPGNAYTPEYRAWVSPQAPAAAPAPVQAVLPMDTQAVLDRWDLYLGPVVVSGLGAGIPGLSDKVFREDAMDRLIAGQSLIDRLPDPLLHAQIDKNLDRVVKSETGAHGFERLESIEQVIRLAGQAGTFDMSAEFGVRGSISSLMDRTAQLALAAGILALKDAKIPLVRHYKRSTTGSLIPTSWGLPTALQEETGVIMASAWPGLDSLVEDLTRFFAYKYSEKPSRLVYEMYDKMIGAVKDPSDRKALTDWYVETRAAMPAAGKEEDVYKFSRGFLFRVLALGHAQTSQFIRAKGPCTQVNSACASTTQAVGIAEDWIRTGRAKRVLIVSADDITNSNLMPWLGLGFLASGAATTKDVVSEAALPFDRRRNGMIIGMGASALVVEDGRKARERGVAPLAEVLSTQFDNSAYHVTRLSTRHVAATMNKLLAKAEKRHGLRRSDMAGKMLFMSHETYTPAQGGSSAAEVEALKSTFGPDTTKVIVTNTKGFTGHSMGASLEDVIAIRAMNVGKLPPIANYKEPDPNLAGITLSDGKAHDLEFALRLGAGFGSQIAMTLTRRMWKEGAPRIDEPVYQNWLKAVSGRGTPELEVVHNTLRVKDAGKPAHASDEGEDISAAPKSPAAPVAVAAPVRAVAPAPVAPARANLDEAAVTKEIVALVTQKTGYPAEMLELDLDMEADLGIDTVKQAELIGLIRDQYAIAKSENLSLKDYPTLRHVVKFVLSGGGAPTAAAASAPTPAPVVEAPKPAPVVSTSTNYDEATVTREIVALVTEKTGYPAEMLELDLDMEADLGIDTVKQAELIGIIRDKYAIAKSENLSLKDYPTLRHVVKFVLSGGGSPTDLEAPLPRDSARSAAPVVEAPKQAPSIAPIAEAPEAAPILAPVFAARGDLDEATVTKEIVALVTEKTGYPAEMLELDLDMEADLGIDTVKQAELIGIIRDKYAIAKSENLSLKDYPTLRHVVKFVMAGPTASEPALPRDSARSGEPAVQSGPQPIEVDEEVASSAMAVLEPEARFSTWSLESYPRPAHGKAPALSKDAPVVVLAAEPEKAAPFAEAVAAAGGEAVVVKTDWPGLEKAEAVIRKALKDKPCGGLLDITALEGAALKAEDMTPPEFDKAYKRGPRSLFLAAKALREDLAVPGRFIVTVTAAGGDHGCTSAAEFDPMAGSTTGLAKALQRELPKALVRAVDFDAAAAPSDMARLALEEVGSDDPRLEPGWQKGTRLALRMVRKPLPAEAPRKLSNRSVVLITGGGQGLGAELAKELARRSKCHLVLFGRTPLEKEAATWVRLSQEELDAMKKRMWEELKADKTVKATPAVLERQFSKVRKAIDLHRAIEAMSLAGSKVQYLQTDMADGASVAKSVKAALKGHGRIDFVIHAAGLEESKLLADKKVEDFDRVYRAKAHGAFNLLKSVPPVRGQRWAFFSSVVGRFGNIGQADYAAASDFLAKLSASMNAKRRGAVTEAVGGKNLFTAPAVTFDLTAFSEIGMATRGSVEAFLKSQGVDFMPPAEGVRLMLEVLLGDAESHEVLVAGALGVLDAEGLIVRGAAPKASEAALPRDNARSSAPVAAPRANLDENVVTKEIVGLVVDKTGYPAEMLELDLDMEADLGIDTVKQAELIGIIREKYAIAKSENLSLKDYPTLRHVVQFVMSAPAGGEAAPAAAPQAPETPKPAPVAMEAVGSLGKLPKTPLFDEVLSKNGDGTKTGKTFSLESDPWLKDHSISGTPYVAGVMGIELFAETAGKRLGKAPAVLEDVHFALPIKLLRQKPITVRTVTGEGSAMRIESDFVTPQGIKLGGPRTHFTARVPSEVPPAGALEARAAAFVKGLTSTKAVVSAKAVYEAYFHGPRFQVLAGITAIGEEELVGLYHAPKAPLWDGGGRELVFQPMLIEAAFQTCGYRDLHFRKKMTLPDSVERVRVFDGSPAPKDLFVYARWRGTAVSGDGAERSVYDACILDKTGKAWASLEGYRMIATS